MMHSASLPNKKLRRLLLPPILVVLAASLIVIVSDSRTSAVTDPGYSGLSDAQRGTLDVAAPGGISINTFSGNLLLRRTLFNIPAKGIPVQLQVIYNSDHQLITSPLGFGWNHSYNIRYTKDSSGNVTIIRGDGRKDTFTWTGTEFTSPPGVYMTLTEPTAGQLKLATKDGIEFHFADSSHQKLTSIQDPNGNAVTFSYDATARLATVTDESGRTYTFTYDASERLTQVTDTALSQSYTLAYDGSGRLTDVTDPLSNNESYSYDAENLLTGITDRRGNATSVTYTTPAWDADTRLPQSVTKGTTTVSLNFDDTTDTTTVTDGNAGNWSYAYAAAETIASLTDPDSNSFNFTWDATRNLANLIDRNGDSNSWTYDAQGNMLSWTDPLLNNSTFTYDPTFSRVLTATDRNGDAWSHTYDAAETERDHLLLRLFWETGMRVSEGVKVKVADVGRDGIRVLGKCNVERVVFIQNGLVSAILFHAINFLNCGGRLDALQEQLGHRDINTTRIYLRLSDEDVKREVGKIQF